jgi:hypothetical protein
MDAAEDAIVTHDARERPDWKGRERVQSRCLDETLSNETAGDRRTERARTLARVRWAKLRPRTASAVAPCSPPTPSVRAFCPRPTLRAATAACDLLGAPNCCLTPS